ncbi:DNA polymerase alpha subunit B [Echinops telfairi]|uniref:DNA polymerase alpha subunit B n=1 Tax=Echinops telfairi TaxID=9371 RepID=A0AC55DMY7_ECHTE|nr:DNA polymerase alpha subunit B [Echinops telfairi]
MPGSAQQLAEELEIFGLDCGQAVLEKLAELCVLYRQNEEEMAGELVAFVSTRKVDLTPETLSSFEHEFLSKQLSKGRPGASRENEHAGTRDIISIQELIEVEEEEETLLNSYTTPSKGSQKRAIATPETPLTKRNASTRSPRQLLSPSSFSPSATPSQKYSSRGHRGEVVTFFGEPQGVSWSGRGGAGSISLQVLGCPEPLTKSYKFMFQKLADVREVLTCRIEELGSELKEHYKIEAFTSIQAPAQEPVTMLGRIGCDSNGKLNSKSVILEGDREHSSGAQIPVDLSELKEYSLFPGQVVIMEGFNATGRKLIATKLYEVPRQPLPDSPRRMSSPGCRTKRPVASRNRVLCHRGSPISTAAGPPARAVGPNDLPPVLKAGPLPSNNPPKKKEGKPGASDLIPPPLPELCGKEALRKLTLGIWGLSPLPSQRLPPSSPDLALLPITDLEQIMVLLACGPYTTSDSITYEPLLDLLAVINRDRPDVCILFGPFLDAKHEQVESCLLTSPFEDVFKQCLGTVIEGTKSSGSHLVIVPSVRDVHHEPVYPQPPFSYANLSKEDKKRVHFVSEPCSVSVNGAVFGLTSTDLLFHMGAEEISSSSGSPDRFSRILKHILTQRSYYPLYPPQEDMAIDYENFYTYAQLPVTPDILVTPSELRYFVKDVLGCVCVNPGRLTKGQVGGTFARLYLRRRQPEEEAGRRGLSVAAQVVRI